MSRRTLVIASGDTERRALPNLMRDLVDSGVGLDVRMPPAHKPITEEIAVKVARAAYWHSQGGEFPLEKIVVLVDTDARSPELALQPVSNVPRLLADLGIPVKLAYARRHLEAWFFADEQGLRRTLGGALGNVDATRPDEIENPKLHLSHLLTDRVYTAREAERISQAIDPVIVRSRSESFRRFHEAVRDGVASTPAPE